MSRRLGVRLTWGDMAGVIAVMVESDITWRDAAELLSCHRDTARRLMKGIHKQGLAHIVEWTIPDDVATANGATQLYRWGPGDDVAPLHDGRRTTLERTPVSVITMCECIKALQAEDHLGTTLAEHVGIHPRTALSIIKALRSAKLIHITGHQERQRFGAGHPYYTWDPGKRDARKPRPLTTKEIYDRWNRLKSERRRAARTLSTIKYGTALDKRRAVAREATA